MAFDDLVRTGVSLANDLTGSLQTTVTHEAWTGMDELGDETYAGPVTLNAIVNQRQRERRTNTGETIMTRAEITILETITPNGAAGRVEPIDNRDRITLPDGTTGPIVDTEGILDPDTNRPYFARVWLGSTGGSS